MKAVPIGAALLLCASAPLHAQDAGTTNDESPGRRPESSAELEPGNPEKSTLSFTVENDSFLGTDRYYTHGFRLQYMHRANELPGWSSSFLTNLPALGGEIRRQRIGFALGQELYTPANVRARRLMQNDRPYGAWLHGSLILRRAGVMCDRFPFLDEFELDLGVIGPEALGEQTQSWWHDTVGYLEPRGWDHQLGTEPAVQTYLTRSVRFGVESDNFWGADFVPHVKAALGNIYIYGEAGGMIRAGYNLPSEYVVSPLESFSTHPSYHPPKWSIYGFAGADGKIVGRNLFLDGSTFTSSHSVEKEVFVADLRVGGAIRYGPLEGVVSLVHRTKEFELQDSAENFVSVTLQFHF